MVRGKDPHGFTEANAPLLDPAPQQCYGALRDTPGAVARGRGPPQPRVSSALHSSPGSAHPGARVLRAFAEAFVKLATKVSLALRGLSPSLRSLLFWFVFYKNKISN